MTIVVLTPPASEPVSLAEAKSFLRIDHNAEDALIGMFILAAREAIEHMCGRMLITRSVRETLDQWRLDGMGAALLEASPVRGIDAVRLLDADGDTTIIPESSYRLDGQDAQPRLVFSASAPLPLRAIGGIEIDYDAGYGESVASVPSKLRVAILHVVAALYEAREGLGALPQAARALAAPFTPVRL
jgi:uncharacterized phiE125 gp8 family phage protein